MMIHVECVTLIVELNLKLQCYCQVYVIIVMYIYLFKGLYQAQAGYNPNNGNEKVVFKNYPPFTDCMSEINNTQIDNAKHVHVIMLLYNLIQYSDNYSKTSGSLWQYYRDEPALTDSGAIANFHASDNSALFKYKRKIADVIDDDSTINVEIMVLLTHLSNSWKKS